jgi:hypothetical protein
MKTSDIAMIILISAISIGAAFALVSAIPGLKAPSKPVSVKTIEQYNSNVTEPDSSVFNKDAINPTVDVTIGNTPTGN